MKIFRRDEKTNTILKYDIYIPTEFRNPQNEERALVMSFRVFNLQRVQTGVKMECLWCGKPLWGRSDKKFCDAGCRSTYHNARRRKEGEEIKKVNRFLGRNYNILKSLDQRRIKCISVGKLMEMGFNPGYFTGSRFPGRRPGQKAGTVVYFCYDYSYTLNRTHLYLHSGRKEI